jgi:hypothetical protein
MKILATRPKLSMSVLFGRKTGCRLARRFLARARLAVLRHELAVARELQDVRVGTAVAADPHEALVITTMPWLLSATDTALRDGPPHPPTCCRRRRIP